MAFFVFMDVSPALLAAQKRLEAIRKRQGITPTPAAERPALPVSGEQPDRAAALAWGQAALLRRREAERERQGRMASHEESGQGAAAPAPAPTAAALPTPAPTIRTYPSLNTAMIAANVAPVGRVWYLLRYLDRDGRGWLPVDAAREALTRGGPLHLCTWRNLRKILARGEGQFWQRDEQDRLFLLGPARVAATLNVERLRGRPVLLPVATLAGDLAALRAALFASYHAGRRAQQPVTRRTMEQLTGVPARTQRHYDRLARTRRKRNICIGGQREQAYKQESAWQHGRGSFAFVDHHGRRGKPGRAYMAWQLPNSYQSPLEATKKGRQRRHNRSLDLVHKGALGNGGGVTRLFYHSGAAAGRAFNRHGGDHDAYFRGQETRGGAVLWHVLQRE